MVPYAPIVKTTVRYEDVRCPICGEVIREFERKDFESFRHVNYADHVKQQHPEAVK